MIYVIKMYSFFFYNLIRLKVLNYFQVCQYHRHFRQNLFFFFLTFDHFFIILFWFSKTLQSYYFYPKYLVLFPHFSKDSSIVWMKINCLSYWLFLNAHFRSKILTFFLKETLSNWLNFLVSSSQYRTFGFFMKNDQKDQ